jgi:hypothetical protein
VVAAVALFARTAFAQTDEEIAARRVLVQRAEAARDAGHHDEALDLAERAGRIQMSPSLRLFIAQEEESLGRLAAAFGSTDACVREAERATGIPNRDAIIGECRALNTSLVPRVGYVNVRAPSPEPAGLVVRVDGTVLRDALLGTPFMVTPGSVRVRAEATGMQPFEREVRAEAGQTVNVSLEFVAAPQVTPTPTMTPAPSRTVVVTRRYPAWLSVSAVGGAALVASAVFFVLRNDALAHCSVQGDTAMCDSPANVARAMNDAPLYNTLTNVSLIAGGVLVAGGLALYWFGVTHEHRAVAIVPTFMGGAVAGVF